MAVGIAMIHVLFHGLNALVLRHIGLFPVLSCRCMLLFWPPDWLHSLLVSRAMARSPQHQRETTQACRESINATTQIGLRQRRVALNQANSASSSAPVEIAVQRVVHDKRSTASHWSATNVLLAVILLVFCITQVCTVEIAAACASQSQQALVCVACCRWSTCPIAICFTAKQQRWTLRHQRFCGINVVSCSRGE
jgi:uncharacterized integral membrane protein